MPAAKSGGSKPVHRNIRSDLAIKPPRSIGDAQTFQFETSRGRPFPAEETNEIHHHRSFAASRR
jgi:hypothetical protein